MEIAAIPFTKSILNDLLGLLIINVVILVQFVADAIIIKHVDKRTVKIIYKKQSSQLILL